MNTRWIPVVLGSLLLACSSSETEPATQAPDAGTQQDTGVEDAASDTAPDAAPDAAADAPDVEAEAGASLERRTYSGPLGLRDYLVYRPSGAGDQDLPAVVVLHGCSQSADGFAALTGIYEIAEAEGFVTILPEQPSTANPWRCWNWFLGDHQKRDAGEAALISAIVDEVTSDGGVDDKRVYAVGLSAGGAMSVVLGTVFPDKFAAVGSVEGCPFKGTPCVETPSSLSGDELAVLAHEAMGQRARALPVFVVQGDADTDVPPANGDLLVEQWLGVADLVDDGVLDGSISREPASTSSETAPGGKSYEVLHYEDAQGGELIRRWTVQGLGHAWPGGAPGTAFSDPEGPDAAAAAWSFFSQHTLP